MNITYGSVCSGIEAASMAWEPLGMKPSWFSQFDPDHNYKRGPDFPSAVLAHHWPDVSNLGDMTKIAEKVLNGDVAAPDILVGGTPCQAFSVAGARAGLSDPRGQLTLSYVDLANAIDNKRASEGKRSTIIVWENVPGVLNSKDNAFGCFLGALSGEDDQLIPPGKKWSNAGCVFGPQRAVAWRILDAQYFGVAQRRRRVFVVASARADFDPTKVLFESEGVRRDIAPSRGAGKSVAALTANGVGTCGADDNQAQAGHLVAAFGGGNRSGAIDVAACLTARGQRIDFEVETFLAQFSSTGQGAWAEGCGTLRAREQESHEHLAVTAYGFRPRIGRNGRGDMGDICHTLSAEAGETGKGDSAPCVAIAFAENSRAEVRLEGGDGQVTGALTTGGGKVGQGHPAVVTYPLLEVGKRTGSSTTDPRAGLGIGNDGDPMFTLQAGAQHGVGTNISVRRLTPVECERLQGFPDNHTLIPVTKRKQITADEYAYLRSHFPNMTAEEAYRRAADGPRYKAIGNSMAIPVMKWIGERIMMQLQERSQPEKTVGDYGGSTTPVDIRDLWQTPPQIYRHLDKEFGFSVDLAASNVNKLHDNYITAEMNTLKIEWCGMFGKSWGWLNPPYSSIGPFIEKAIEQQEKGFGTVMLVPSDTSVGWFSLALTSVSEVRFITGGRLSFIRADTGKAVNGNNKGSMLLIFSPDKIGARQFGTVDRDTLMATL